MRPYVALTLVLMSAGCATAPAATPSRPAQARTAVALAVLNGGVSPKTIDVRKQETAILRYELTREATVSIDLVDEDGRVARRLAVGRQDAGYQQASWDGRVAGDQLAPSGVYRYVIHAQDAQGREAVYDPSTETGGEEFEPWKFTFEKETGTFKWVMPKAGFARLRVGVQGFPHLRTLLDWEPLEAGERTLVWDGLDASGLIHLSDHPQLAIKLNAFAMPDNTLIVRGEATTDAPSDAPTYPSLAKPTAAYLHARHPRAGCHEARVRIEFPTGTRYDTQGRPQLSGIVPVRVVLDARDAPALVNSRFEVSVYEDLTFLTEEEDGTNPFTYLWDTTHLTPGAHLLTVNVLSYDDHYGVITMPVVIEKGS